MKTTLKANVTYCVKFHVVNSNDNTVGIDAIGIYFGDNNVDTITYCRLPLTYLLPQVQNPTNNIINDTLNWVVVTGTYTANGTEKFAILGNFSSNAQTNTIVLNPSALPFLAADMFFEDVSVIELDLPAFAGRDTNFIPGDSIFLGREPDVGIDEACIWYKLPGTTPIDTIAGFWIKPTNTCTYVVRQEICGLVKWDTVIVRLDAVGLEEQSQFPNEITLLPNPAAGEFTIQSAREMQYISIEDVSGRVIYENKTPANTTLILIQTELSDGVYFVRVLDALGGEQRKRLVVCH